MIDRKDIDINFLMTSLYDYDQKERDCSGKFIKGATKDFKKAIVNFRMAINAYLSQAMKIKEKEIIIFKNLVGSLIKYNEYFHSSKYLSQACYILWL